MASLAQRKTLGAFLKKKRLEKGVHVDVLLTKIQRSASYYYKLENGLVPISSTIIRRLFDFYGVAYAK